MQPESPRRFTPLPPTPPRGRRLGLHTEDTWSYADIDLSYEEYDLSYKESDQSDEEYDLSYKESDQIDEEYDLSYKESDETPMDEHAQTELVTEHTTGYDETPVDEDKLDETESVTEHTGYEETPVDEDKLPGDEPHGDDTETGYDAEPTMEQHGGYSDTEREHGDGVGYYSYTSPLSTDEIDYGYVPPDSYYPLEELLRLIATGEITDLDYMLAGLP